MDKSGMNAMGVLTTFLLDLKPSSGYRMHAGTVNMAKRPWVNRC